MRKITSLLLSLSIVWMGSMAPAQADTPDLTNLNLPVVSSMSGKFVSGTTNTTPYLEVTMGIQEKVNALSTLTLSIRPTAWIANAPSYLQKSGEVSCNGKFDVPSAFVQVSRVANTGGFLETITVKLQKSDVKVSDICLGTYGIYAVSLTDTANHKISTYWSNLSGIPGKFGWTSTVHADVTIPEASITPVCQKAFSPARTWWMDCVTNFNYKSVVATYDKAAADKAAADKAAADKVIADAAAAKIAAAKATADAKVKADAAAKAAADKATADAIAAAAKAKTDLTDATSALAKANLDNKTLLAQFDALTLAIDTMKTQVASLTAQVASTQKLLATSNTKITKICSAKPKPKGC